jgi:hypothetical protein
LYGFCIYQKLGKSTLDVHFCAISTWNESFFSFCKSLAMFLMFLSFVWKLSSIILEQLGAVHTYSRSPQWQINYEAGRIQALCTHTVALLNAQKTHHKCVPEPHQDSWRGTGGFSP